MINSSQRFQEYLQIVAKPPYKKVARLEFLNPDNSVAFALSNSFKRGYNTRYDSRAFIQSGTLSVSLNNGQRRKATVTLSNLDNAFDFAVNKLWFGQQVRLSMGVELSDGTDFLLPQGVFYLKEPQMTIKPNARTATYNLVDKWAYLDGTLLGVLANSYEVPRRSNIFQALQGILHIDKYTFDNNATDIARQIDNVPPIFTTYYNNKIYQAKWSDGAITEDISYLLTPYQLIEAGGSNLGQLALKLNEMLVGWIGYNSIGALSLEPSQDDISDNDKAVLWTFTTENSVLFGLNETVKNSEVYNDILVAGTSLTGQSVYGRATNRDPRSDTNANLIGLRTLRENGANYWNAEQCIALAQWRLKRKTVLQKSISIQCSQLFHLFENGVVAVKRTDKSGSPIEKHLINSFSIPLAETGAMTINATSIQDFPNLNVEPIIDK